MAQGRCRAQRDLCSPTAIRAAKEVVYQSLGAPTLDAAMTRTYPAAEANIASRDYIEAPAPSPNDGSRTGRPGKAGADPEPLHLLGISRPTHPSSASVPPSGGLLFCCSNSTRSATRCRSDISYETEHPLCRLHMNIPLVLVFVNIIIWFYTILRDQTYQAEANTKSP